MKVVRVNIKNLVQPRNTDQNNWTKIRQLK